MHVDLLILVAYSTVLEVALSRSQPGPGFSEESPTADLSRKKPTVGRVPGYVGLPEGRARPGASRSKIVVNFYRTKSNNDDPLND